MINWVWKQDVPGSYRLLALLLIIVAGFAIRLHDLDRESFWIDEILAVRSTRTGITSIWEHNDHPPLFYAFEVAAVKTFEESEFSARVPSLMAGTLAIAAIAFLGSALGAPGAGLWAALFLAFSPLALRYSQEARHYALLLLLSILSYGILYLALQRPKWSRWLAYAALTALNLYTHYGALIVLASQGILIALWSLKKISDHRAKDVLYPVVSIGVVLALFAPWIPRLLIGLERNVATDRVSGTGSMAPLSDWLDVAYTNFGMFSHIFAPVLLALCLIGLMYWLIDRAWMQFGFVLSGMVLPLVLILLFQVSRGAFARYIIYMLPFYLLAAGHAVQRTLLLSKHLFGWNAYRALVALCVLGFVFLAWPLISAEYGRVQQDWRSTAAYINEHAKDDYIIAGMALSAPSGYNVVRDALPYYLDKADLPTSVLGGNKLDINDIDGLGEINRPVWVVGSTWTDPSPVQDSSIELIKFPNTLFIARETDQGSSSLDSLIFLYEKIIPVASSPAPSCFMKRDLSTLYLEAKDFQRAAGLLTEAKQLCPELAPWNAVPIYEGMLLAQPATASADQVIELARHILMYDAKNAIALDALTTFSLLTLLEEGKAQVFADNSPEPVDKTRFTMPQNGDWGDVVFAHPPAAISFNLPLPDGPTTFRSRLALAPESWEWGGDGVTFVLQIQDESGKSAELVRQHIGNGPEDHKWHDILVSLDDYAGQTVTLTLMTEPGPAGDGTGDWAGWESPRIMWEIP